MEAEDEEDELEEEEGGVLYLLNVIKAIKQ